MNKTNDLTINSNLTTSLLSLTSNRTIFVSSDISDDNPFVHHFYTKDGEFHYLVYDPIDDIVIEHYPSDSFSLDVFESNPSSSFVFFDEAGFELISPLSLARCELFKKSNTKTFETKIMEDISLITNPNQILSCGYLLNIQNLGNSLAANSINPVLDIISNICLSLEGTIDLGQNKLMQETYLKNVQAIDAVMLAIKNELPLTNEQIAGFKRTVLSFPLLQLLISNSNFMERGGVDCLDLLFGNFGFSSHANFKGTIL
jgi:hypothetical protein